jgi:RNA polymerase sigma factor (sigma-70 family)
LANDLNFEQIVRDHQEMVFRTLLRLNGNREHVEDLAQEVFLRLYRALPAFRGEALLTTYLYRIVVNVAQDEWKRRRRVERPLVSISSPVSSNEDGESDWEDRLAHPGLDAEEQLSQKQFQQLVERQLQHLSEVERTVLVLYHQEERSYEQIADALRLPMGTGKETGMAKHSMNPTDSESKLLDARITLALETPPQLVIPPDFAARVAAQVPPLTPMMLTPRGYGRSAAMICMGVLLALIFAFAHRAGASPLWTSMEWIFCAQFALVAVWLAVRQARPDFVWHF